MVVITEELIRKRAEHNEGLIFSLEEISLHQLDIEKIENIDKLCRDLKILYLQSNLIDKIENVSRLKQLEYLNLALNNVQRVENLEKCENLKKLDLTVNFIAELTSLESLKHNEFLEELYLTGNPCTKYENYRAFVVGSIPQLRRLDGMEVTNTERLDAFQNLDKIRESIVEEQNEYFEKEVREKEGRGGRWYTDIGAETELPETSKDKELTEEEKKDRDKAYWEEPTEYTPETRKEIHRKIEADRLEAEEKRKCVRSNKVEKRETVLERNGKRLNLNQPKWKFKYDNSNDPNIITLDVSIPKYLTTQNIDVDLQTNFVKIVAEGRTFQLVFSRDISPDISTCQRSQATGELSFRMPTLHQTLSVKQKSKPKSFREENSVLLLSQNTSKSKQTFLEFDDKTKNNLDYSRIVENNEQKLSQPINSKRQNVVEKPVSEDFIDDDEVPPLM